MMMSNAKPYDAEVEYLESNGNQYVNTGIYGNLHTELCITYTSLESYASRALAGSRGSTYDNITIFSGTSVNDNRFCNKSARASNTYGTKYIVLINKDVYRRSDGVEIAIGAEVNFTTITPLYILAWNKDLYKAKARLHSAYIKQNDIIVMNLIPVRIGQVGYMYDKVSGQLFGNAGTGSFILGNDIN